MAFGHHHAMGLSSWNPQHIAWRQGIFPAALDPPAAPLPRPVEEAEHPTQPGVKLRRTVIDEVIVEKNPNAPSGK